ncbi:MAG TPA: hypothetical protein VF623_13685, partial [Segetibacter sp.]
MEDKRNNNTSTSIALAIWFYTWVTFSVGGTVIVFIKEQKIESFSILLVTGICSCIGSIPALVLLWFFIGFIARSSSTTGNKFVLLLVLQLIICILYCFLPNLFFGETFSSSDINFILIAIACLFACNSVAVFISRASITAYFSQQNKLDISEDNLDEASTADNSKTQLFIDGQPDHSLIFQPTISHSPNKNNTIMQHNPQHMNEH